jgi:hypothetical protein
MNDQPKRKKRPRIKYNPNRNGLKKFKEEYYSGRDESRRATDKGGEGSILLNTTLKMT